MSSVVSNVLFLISSFFMSYCEVLVWSKFYYKRINYRSFLFYICVLFLTLLGIATHIYVNAFVKVMVVTCFMCLSNWLIFRRSVNETIISTIFGQFILVFADAIFILCSILIFSVGTSFVRDNFFDTFFANLFVGIIYVFMCSVPFIRKIYFKLVHLFGAIKIKYLLFACFLSIISINFLTAIIYYDMKSIYVIIINSCLLLIYSFIVYRAIKEKNNSIIIRAENISLMESLHQYEDMVDRQRVDNHENKNQLLIIKNMIDKKDKDLVNYINSVIKDKKEDDEVLYTRVKTIPSGGLQGIIYQKMLVMKDEKILFSLDVSRDVRKINLDSLSMDDNYRLCKIVGVLLDNAIEASREVDGKCIMISLYVDDEKLIVDISNRFSGIVDIDKLDDEGYTSKGDGHGYGLSLVKKILSETDIFENERSIKKNIFKQVIKVKIKNT